MDRAVVKELIARFQKPAEFAAPVEYYREVVRTTLAPRCRARPQTVYDTPITVPATLGLGHEGRGAVLEGCS